MLKLELEDFPTEGPTLLYRVPDIGPDHVVERRRAVRSCGAGSRVIPADTNTAAVVADFVQASGNGARANAIREAFGLVPVEIVEAPAPAPIDENPGSMPPSAEVVPEHKSLRERVEGTENMLDLRVIAMNYGLPVSETISMTIDQLRTAIFARAAVAETNGAVEAPPSE